MLAAAGRCLRGEISHAMGALFADPQARREAEASAEPDPEIAEAVGLEQSTLRLADRLRGQLGTARSSRPISGEMLSMTLQPVGERLAGTDAGLGSVLPQEAITMIDAMVRRAVRGARQSATGEAGSVRSSARWRGIGRRSRCPRCGSPRSGPSAPTSPPDSAGAGGHRRNRGSRWRRPLHTASRTASHTVSSADSSASSASTRTPFPRAAACSA